MPNRGQHYLHTCTTTADSTLKQASYGQFGYDPPYVTPHTSSLASFSPPTEFSKHIDAPLSEYQKASSLTGFSPAPEFPKATQPPTQEYTRVSESSFANIPRTTDPSYLYGFVHIDSQLPARPRSSPSTFSPTNPPGGPIDYSWTLNPLGISTSNAHESFYCGTSCPPVRARTPRCSEPSMTPVTEIAAPQPRRTYAPILPHPVGVQKMGQLKRPREEEDSPDATKRRKRSESSAIPVDLGEEDRLLIQLKDEENMPWKDIAIKFQTDLGKVYQIPALQMRLKRLRERMRVWSDADVRALRSAHEYWVHSKFEIISQKVSFSSRFLHFKSLNIQMLEYGAAERWPARQCARKLAEIDPGPTPYTAYDHSTPSYTTYAMSPVEGPPFLPFLHIP
jgi:hypothetical protein